MWVIIRKGESKISGSELQKLVVPDIKIKINITIELKGKKTDDDIFSNISHQQIHTSYKLKVLFERKN